MNARTGSVGPAELDQRAILGHDSNISPAMLTDPLIAFALGMFTLTRLEMYLRAKRMLEEVRGRN